MIATMSIPLTLCQEPLGTHLMFISQEPCEAGDTVSKCYQQRKGGSERVTNFPKVTQLLSGHPAPPPPNH